MAEIFTEGQKERAKWEQLERDCPRGLQPGNPYTYRPYPKMLYKANRLDSGKYAVAVAPPPRYGFPTQDEWQMGCQQAANFNSSCQMTVNTEAEHKRAREEGWRDDPTEAMQFQAALEKVVSDAAAERNYRDRNMGEKALEESNAAEKEHFGHLGEIPEKPIAKRRGRPPKATPPAA